MNQLDKEEEKENCPVCLLELGQNNKMITQCGHSLCGSCFLSNLNFTIKCPMCRQDMVDVNSVQIPLRTVHRTMEENSSINLRSRYSDLILQHLIDSHWDISGERAIIRAQIINLLHSFELDLGNRTLRRPLSLSDMSYDIGISESDSELDEIIANLEIPEN